MAELQRSGGHGRAVLWQTLAEPLGVARCVSQRKCLQHPQIASWCIPVWRDPWATLMKEPWNWKHSECAFKCFSLAMGTVAGTWLSPVQNATYGFSRCPATSLHIVNSSLVAGIGVSDILLVPISASRNIIWHIMDYSSYNYASSTSWIAQLVSAQLHLWLQDFWFLQNSAYISEVPLALNFPFSRDTNLFSPSILPELISQLKAVFCHLRTPAAPLRWPAPTASLLLLCACGCTCETEHQASQ